MICMIYLERRKGKSFFILFFLFMGKNEREEKKMFLKERGSKKLSKLSLVSQLVSQGCPTNQPKLSNNDT